MRLFWVIIGIFMIFAGFIAWAQVSPDRRSGDVAMRDAPAPDAPARATARPSAETPDQHDEVDVMKTDPPRETPPDERPRSDSSEADTDPDSDRQSRQPNGSTSDESTLSEAELRELDEAQKLADELFDSAMSGGSARSDGENSLPNGLDNGPTPPTSLDQHEHQPDRLQNPENPWEAAAQQDDEHHPLEHSVDERPDGTIVLDETFEIRGKGTRQEPYQVTWDLLLSAAETYQPRLGMNKIPERIQMLDGKYVRISGHLLFPMVGVDAREVLVMLNMWDGCCLGTIPSPYDAVEVQLAEPFRANQRNFMNHGTLEGRLSIDPYLINDWLLGLYVMEDARLNIGM